MEVGIHLGPNETTDEVDFLQLENSENLQLHVCIVYPIIMKLDMGLMSGENQNRMS